MKLHEYSYSILRYRHDVASGEQLNFGVVLLCRESGTIVLRNRLRYRRLSEAFSSFDGSRHLTILNSLEMGLNQIGRQMTEGFFQMEERHRFRDAYDLLRAVWPDQGTSYYASPALHGVTDDLLREADDLFERFVLRQGGGYENEDRFDDDKLWGSFHRAFSLRGAPEALLPVRLGKAEVEFDHGYKNGKWHVFEAVSLDYVDEANIRRKAYTVAGKASAVSDAPELGSLSVLIGRPRRRDFDRTYEAAQVILQQAPGPVRIYEEDQLGRLAETVEQAMREHGIIAPGLR